MTNRDPYSQLRVLDRSIRNNEALLVQQQKQRRQLLAEIDPQRNEVTTTPTGRKKHVPYGALEQVLLGCLREQSPLAKPILVHAAHEANGTSAAYVTQKLTLMVKAGKLLRVAAGLYALPHQDPAEES